MLGGRRAAADTGAGRAAMRAAWGAMRAALLLLPAALGGCAAPEPAAVSRTWLVGRALPGFDPEAPPDPVRWALERLTTHGLLAEDSTGRIVPAAAGRIEVSADRLVHTYHLRRDLRFVDGSPCRSEHFRAALVAGLGDPRHATRRWLLRAVRGVERVRAGRPLPSLGIETPDPWTVVVRLERPDPDLDRKLALPGVSGAWRDRGAARWGEAVGLGPYRVHEGEGAARRFTLVRQDSSGLGGAAPGPDTVHVRFASGVRRLRSLLRHVEVDLAWPVPPELLDEELPVGYRAVIRPARPARTLLLVQRADLPPTSKLAARRALAHAINRPALLRALGPSGVEVGGWLEGAPPFDHARLDRDAAARWMASGRLGRSFLAGLAYDPDGAGGAVARPLQGEWANASIYVRLNALRGEPLRRELLSGRSHLLLVEHQPLLDGLGAALASLAMPLRGPPVGGFRSGWRTRELDHWIEGSDPVRPGEAAAAQRRVEEERVAIPLASLPWAWVERGPASFHPRYGPGFRGHGGEAARRDRRDLRAQAERH